MVERAISRRSFLKAGAIAGGLMLVNPIEAVSAFSGQKMSREALTAERVYAPGEIVRRGDQSVQRYFLTLDDCGSLARVEYVANLAESEGVKLTFFPTGLNVVKGKDVWARVLSKGHDIENHTWDHKKLTYLSIEQVRSEMVRQQDAVAEVARIAGLPDYKHVFIRPPYGAGRKDPEVVSVAKELGLVIAMWSSDPQGFKSSVTEQMVYDRAMEDLAPGIILLQHTNVKDINALGRIIRSAKEKGYVMDKTLREGIRTTVYTPAAA
jgi:peptidoglycan-N-acetylglucosamine deacetylase